MMFYLATLAFVFKFSYSFKIKYSNKILIFLILQLTGFQKIFCLIITLSEWVTRHSGSESALPNLLTGTVKVKATK